MVATEAGHLQWDGRAIFVWHTPDNIAPLLKWIVVNGLQEVECTATSYSDTVHSTAWSNMVCLGEGVCCTADLGGKRMAIPVHVQAWLMARKHGVGTTVMPTQPAISSNDITPPYGMPITKVAPASTARQEKPCPTPSCKSMNDVGVKVCWNCGCQLAT